MLNALTCTQAAAANTAGPGCAGWPSGSSAQGFGDGQPEVRWHCGSCYQWPRFPRSQNLSRIEIPSVLRARPTGRERRPAGNSGNPAAFEAASEQHNKSQISSQTFILKRGDICFFSVRYLGRRHVLKRHPAADKLTDCNTQTVNVGLYTITVQVLLLQTQFQKNYLQHQSEKGILVVKVKNLTCRSNSGLSQGSSEGLW